MNKTRLRILSIICVMAILSCGPKKGIVTKKKDQKEQTSSSRESSRKTSDAKKEASTKRSSTRVPKSNSAVDIYVANYADIAMTEMRRYHIPASITLAQGILESGSGKGRLAVEANNHFGIKCHGWTGKKIYHDDDRNQECFRKYDDPMQSYEDHSKFLSGRRRYESLFTLKRSDYKGWAKGLKKAGYATDRNYPKKLIALIERYHLDEFDREVLGTTNSRKRRSKKAKDSSKPTVSVNDTYVVKEGDTLYSLSKRFGMSVDDLKQLNQLRDNTISIGQTLIISKK